MILRSDNLVERSVLEVLGRRMSMTVAGLADELAIPVPTAVGVVGRLYERGLLCRREYIEGGPSPEPSGGRWQVVTQGAIKGMTRGQNFRARGRGRPRYQYSLRLPEAMAIFQFDGTELSGGLFDENQVALAMEMLHVPTVKSPADAAGLMNELLGSLLRNASLNLSNLRGVAVCLNAIRVRGKTLSSSVLPWVDDRTQRVFGEMLGLPVQLIHTPNLAAEVQQLDQATDSVAYLHVGDGVSSHFCAEGKPYHGVSRRAGELGHVIADPQSSILCGCGRRGCLESLVSGPAIVQHVRQIAKMNKALPWLQRIGAQRSARVVMDQLWQAWQDDEPVAVELMEPVLDRLGWGMGLLVNMLDPQVIIIGGYVLQHHSAWRDEVVRRARPWILHGDTWQAQVVPASASMQDILRMIATRYVFNLFKQEQA